MKEMIKLGTFLLVLSVIAAAALSLTYIVTSPRIEAEKQSNISSALKESCLPDAYEVKEEKTYYVGYNRQGNVLGYAFRVSPKGYGGPIDMIVGINGNGKVAGIKILSMSETPGLGTQANSIKFLGQFTGKTIKDGLKAKKDIDAISGATITSQAVSDGVKKALVLFDKL